MHKTRSSSRSRTRRSVHARAKANARTYDANGNRLTSIHTAGSGTATQTVNRTYTVDATSNRILSFTQTQLAGTATTGATSNVNYSFDANGAMTKDGLRSYEFDAANRLGNVTTGTGPDAPTTRYVHNALGQRVFKTEPLYAPVSSGSNPADPGVMQTLANFFASLWGGSTNTAAPSASEKLGYTYYYDEDGSLLYEQGSGGANSGGSAHYVYLPTPAGPMPIATYTGSKHYAVHTDHLNTPRRLTNSAKQVAWQWAFSAFGDEQPTTARNRYVDPATTPNAGTTTVAEVTFNLRYPGQYFDKESNLHYNYFRSYDSRTGRYTQSDPIGLRGGWNRFGYAEQNPLSFTDPTGEIAVPVAAGVCLIVATAIIVNSQSNQSRPQSPNWIDNPTANSEHQAYKDLSCQPPPPDLTGCALLKWKLAVAEATVSAMIAWDSKWLPGRHAADISGRQRGIEKLKEEIKKKCEGCQ